MKWFKHFTDNHRGQSIQTLLDEHGHTGLSCYWILVELCAEKLERSDDNLETENCVFGFHQRILASAMRLKVFKIKELLNSYQTLSLLKVTYSESIINVEMPILLDLLEYGQKKAIQRRNKTVSDRAQEKEEDKEKETYKETEKEIALHPLILLWNNYAPKLSKVNKSNSNRNKKINALWSQNTPEEWCAVISRINASDFCIGKNDRNWKATFDWLLQPDVYLKVSEGKYDNRTSTRGFSNQRPDEDFSNLSTIRTDDRK